MGGGDTAAGFAAELLNTAEEASVPKTAETRRHQSYTATTWLLERSAPDGLGYCFLHGQRRMQSNQIGITLRHLVSEPTMCKRNASVSNSYRKDKI